MIKNTLFKAAFVVLFTQIVLGFSSFANAHEAKCPYCELDITQDTQTQDNEVVLRYGKKRIEYKCVLCAIADAEKSFSGDLVILAPSEIKGNPIEITRKKDQWSAPENTIFVGHKVKHRYCDRGYRAFTSRSAFDAHVQKYSALLKDAQAINLAEMVEICRKDISKK